MVAGDIKIVLSGICKNCNLFDPTIECVRINDPREDIVGGVDHITCTHKECCERAYHYGREERNWLRGQYLGERVFPKNKEDEK